MATTGCPSGEVQTRLRLGQFDEALKAAARVPGHLRQGQLLPGADGPRPRHRAAGSATGCIEIGRKLGIPPVVTNDSHYTYEARGRPRTTCCCASRPASNIADPDRFRFDGTGYYLKSADEMRAVDSSDAWQEGCRNTLLVAEQVDTDGHVRVPQPDAAVPRARGRDRGVAGSARRSARGMARRFPERHPRGARASRPSTRWTSSSRWASRPTSSWSPTSSCGRRTTASRSARAVARRPARSSRTRWASPTSTRSPHGLIFERFLNPERVSMPDVDIDFDERRRGEVIRYVTEK